jgi:hypothetical protein
MIGARDRDAGVIAAGESVSHDIGPFALNQLAKVYFRCDKADQFNCALAGGDISEHYPSGNHKSVTAVFTFEKWSVILLSFEVTEADVKSETRKVTRVSRIS